MTTRRLISAESLPSIVDPPLQTGESTDHQNTSGKTVPASLPAEELHSLHHRDLLSRVVHLGDARVEGVGDQSTEDTSNVTGGEGDGQLSGLAVRLTRLGEAVLVEQTDDVLEGGELDHGVGDLTAPERNHSLPERLDTLSGSDFLHSGSELGGEVSLNRRGLNTDLGGLHRAEEDIGEELSRSRSGQVDGVLPVLGGLLSHHIGVDVLEDFITTELEETLEGVTDHGRLPTSVETLTVPGDLGGLLKTIEQRGVHAGVGLTTALHQIQRSDEGVGSSARQNTSHEAGAVELGIVLRGISSLQSLKRASAEHCKLKKL